MMTASKTTTAKTERKVIFRAWKRNGWKKLENTHTDERHRHFAIQIRNFHWWIRTRASPKVSIVRCFFVEHTIRGPPVGGGSVLANSSPPFMWATIPCHLISQVWINPPSGRNARYLPPRVTVPIPFLWGPHHAVAWCTLTVINTLEQFSLTTFAELLGILFTSNLNRARTYSARAERPPIARTHTFAREFLAAIVTVRVM